MDDTALLEAIRDSERATTAAIARRLDADAGAVARRLSELRSEGRVEREDDGWRLARDPRLDDSVERMRDRLGKENC
ncbi:MAG: winged helix-turn-helix domain-containing protein [Euryarchaeota archaeon]|jgi:predicted transcriptional regulator|nr:winged helix-turn-helix domain-containing protein [Euryarchaeota archaeon]